MKNYGKNVLGRGLTSLSLCFLFLFVFSASIHASEARHDVPYPLYASVEILDEVALIKILAFHSMTYEQVSDIMRELDEAGVTRIIIDLRGNMGGLFDEAVDVSRLFINDGLICTLYIDGQDPIEYYATGIEVEYNLVVLVNAFTASSSELLASAIQESGTGVLVGTKTYGKNSVQLVTVSDDGSVFKITVGMYLTRNGNSVGSNGLTPDHLVRFNGVKRDIKTDSQLIKALELLGGVE